jgi:hypothetical protein
VRLVGEAGPGGGRRRGAAVGEQPPRGPDPQLALVVAGRHAERAAKRPVGRVPAAPGRVGEVVHGQLRVVWRRDPRVVDKVAQPDRHGRGRPGHGDASGECPGCGMPGDMPRRVGEALVARQLAPASLFQRRGQPQQRAGQRRVLGHRRREQRRACGPAGHLTDQAGHQVGPDMHHPVGEAVRVGGMPVVRVVGVEQHDHAGTTDMAPVTAPEPLSACLGDADGVALVAMPVVDVRGEPGVHRLDREGPRAPVPDPVTGHEPILAGARPFKTRRRRPRQAPVHALRHQDRHRGP